jgi:hypothetical protein
MSKNLVLARSESSCSDRRECLLIFFFLLYHFIANSIIAHGRRRCQSQLSAHEHLRSSQQTSLPTCNIQISGFSFPSFVCVYSNSLLFTL